MMSSLAALIYELEHVKKGSPELDVAVYAALGHDLLVPIPRCTRNLQDIVDLVSEGRWWSVGSSQTGFVACLNRRKTSEYGPTPALALCIAVLKAKEAERENHE